MAGACNMACPVTSARRVHRPHGEADHCAGHAPARMGGRRIAWCPPANIMFTHVAIVPQTGQC
jgi:hypothetical protein